MITDLKIVDDETAMARGERYDLERVLGAMCGILEDYAAFAKREGLAGPYTFSTPAPPRSDDDWIVKLLKSAAEPFPLPYGTHTPRLIHKDVLKEKETLDAGGRRRSIEAPPYRFDLYPLGTEPLYANFGLCRSPDVDAEWTTCAGEDWTAYDPAPFLRIHRHLPPLPDGVPERPIDDIILTLAQRKTLTAFLETQKQRGITYETRANGLVEEPVKLAFPHARFGAGIGGIRIALLRAGGD